jgi:uncharacterized protein (TIGR02453 family)
LFFVEFCTYPNEIHPMVKKTTLEFLSDLTDNNQREWFEANKKRYEAAKKDVAALVGELISGITSFDGNLAGLEAKDTLFRIFRDVRFSHDKSPYKNNMGAWMARGGRKSLFAGYYLHIEAGDKSFLAGGSYMPEAPVLKAIREAVDYQPEDFKALLEAPGFVKYFAGLEGEKLKTIPKGYPKDHVAAELLKHKSFVVSHKLSDKDLIAPGFVEQALLIYKEMVPLTQFLNRSIAEVGE